MAVGYTLKGARVLVGSDHHVQSIELQSTFYSKTVIKVYKKKKLSTHEAREQHK